MTTSWSGGVLSERKPGGDALYHFLAAIFGAAAAWIDIKVGDLLLTAMIVVASCMLLGFLSPRKPWRWVLLIGIFLPAVELLAYFFLTEKPTRAQVYESFLGFVPGIAGAYGGAIGRGVVDNLFAKN
jgi:hypothetical protein